MATILIIDDNDELSMLVELLEGEGYETAVANGEIGVRAFTQLRPDLVITDMVMPDSDGRGNPRIRSIDPAARIVAISGGSMIGYDYYLRVAKSLGAYEVVAKPFDLDEFVGIRRSAVCPIPPRPGPAETYSRVPGRGVDGAAKAA